MKFWKDELARGFRRLLEERVYGDHGIAFNDEPFLLRSRFTLSALRLWLLRHTVLLSQRFLSAAALEKVPQPGIGPGRPEWARGCKPRLSASSSTGGYNKALNVGTVTGLNPSPVPALFRPSSAAPILFSWHASCARKNLGDNRDQIAGKLSSLRHSGIRQAVALGSPLPCHDCIPGFPGLFKQTVDTPKIQATRRCQSLKNLGASNAVIGPKNLLAVEKQQYRILNGLGLKPGKTGRGTEKTPVVGIVQRNGDVRFQMMQRITAENIGKFVAENADLSCRIITDELPVYNRVGRAFSGGHERVTHSAGEYVRRGTDVHSNTVEGVFSLIRRGMMGTFHSVSRKHLPNYLNEFQFRWNTRKMSDGQRVAVAIKQIDGKRLEYRESVENPPYLVQSSAPTAGQMDAPFEQK